MALAILTFRNFHDNHKIAIQDMVKAVDKDSTGNIDFPVFHDHNKNPIQDIVMAMD
jgi:hypothetical protein